MACKVPMTSVGIVVHAALQAHADALEFLDGIAALLHQHGVPSVVLAECATCDQAAAATAGLLPTCRAGSIKLAITQPSNTFASLRAAVDLLRLAPSNIAVTSWSSSQEVHSFAQAAGCRSTAVAADNAQAAVLASVHSIAALAVARTGALCVGYAMKPSRRSTLTQQQMLPLLPVDGVCFVPVNLQRSFHEQLHFDVLLHKATDFLEGAPGSGAVPVLNAGVAEQLEALSAAGVCVVDPPDALNSVMDRALCAVAVEAACRAARKQGVPVRSPVWVLCEQVDAGSAERAAAAGVQLPCIVKPQAACGVPEAHLMAFVLHPDGFVDPGVPTPAIVQEYVDHRGIVWKVYVAGQQVFVVNRKSTPDLQSLVQRLAAAPGSDIPACVNFDSLEALPTSLPWLHPKGRGGIAEHSGLSAGQQPGGAVRQDMLELLAGALRGELGLTLFGFDVVFDYAAGEAVVVDVNYFPSFKGIPEAPAALRAALFERARHHRSATKSARR